VTWLSIPKAVYGAICRYIEHKKIPPKGSEPRFKPNWLIWPIDRSTNTFRVYVVEPREYCATDHGIIFKAALDSLINTENMHVDSYSAEPITKILEPFDLVTFPEAFLSSGELVSVLKKISELGSLGCVHVGLRPSAEGHHLYKVAELKELINSLSNVPNISTNDFVPFNHWLNMQTGEDQFNIACLFTIDAHQSVRVCLHPKLVRSQYETSPIHERHMKEANLLTLVTLQPEDRVLPSITLQPLICADALFLDTDRPNNRPMEAVNTSANCFESLPPDHIDIVSVATCTPQKDLNNATYRQWHQQFRNSFVRAAADPVLARHHNATFVLSNYGRFGKEDPAGLSGAFIPIPLRNVMFPPFVTVSAWGRPTEFPEHDNTWSQPTEEHPLGMEWSSLGYIASLDPFKKNNLALACMLGFTIQRLPRTATRWLPMSGLIDFQLRTATIIAETDDVVFRKEGSND
jgi:hypothetical protein